MAASAKEFELVLDDFFIIGTATGEVTTENVLLLNEFKFWGLLKDEGKGNEASSFKLSKFTVSGTLMSIAALFVEY